MDESPPTPAMADPSEVVWAHAEDVAQTSLLKAAQHLDGFRGESSVRTWLHRITTNECRMIRRRLTARSLDAILESPNPPEHAALTVSADPESLAEERELGRRSSCSRAIPNCRVVLRSGMFSCK